MNFRTHTAPLFEHLRKAITRAVRDPKLRGELIEVANQAARAINQERPDQSSLVKAFNELNVAIHEQCRQINSIGRNTSTHSTEALLDVLLATALIVDTIGMRGQTIVADSERCLESLLDVSGRLQ